MIRQVDYWLLDRVFTPVATWIRDRNGSSQFDVAREMIFSGFTLIIFSTFTLILASASPGLDLFCILFCAAVWFFLRPWEYRQIGVAEFMGGLWARENRLVTRVILIVLWSLNLWNNSDIWDWISLLGYTMFVLSHFFRAVVLPPPKPREEFKEVFA